jgi:aspartyl-tRNA(Asn)/glutamyl-tRNA(Gln) amidotransferase subunit A
MTSPARSARLATVGETRDLVQRGERSATEICEAALARIDALYPHLHAFTTIARDRARERARTIDQDPARRSGALAGVPVSIKDNLCTRGLSTTASSRMLEGFVPPYDATVVARLEAAGAVIVGKTNCDEFAMGSSTENSAFGPTRNPWAADRVPGGSSGGSAAAVAAGLTPLSLGSDTGGSIRQPAAHCGVVGLKPTYGRVSRYGLLAYASSLDQVGPLTRTSADAALALSVIAGHDTADATSASDPVPDYEAGLTGDLRGVRIGVPVRLLERGVDDEVTGAMDRAIEVLVARGARRVEIDLPYAASAIPVYYLIATAEASSNLARYDGVRYGFRAAPDSDRDDLRTMYARTRARGFGSEVKRRIMLGTYVLSAGYYDAYYLKAQRVRTLIRRDYDAAFVEADVIVMPTSPTPPFRLGECTSDPLQMYLTDVFTVTANLAGLPALSTPCGFSAAGLPIGLQITGRLFDEAAVLRVGDAHERDTDWWTRQPTDPPGTEERRN